MSKRIQVDVKWNGRAFAPFDRATGRAIREYSNLTYGDNAASRAGQADDALESVKTLVAGTRADKTDAVVTGWCDVPDA